MDMFDPFTSLGVPGPGRRDARTGEESAAELGCLLFLPLVELVAALVLKLAVQPTLAMLVLPAALATLAYPISTLLGTGRAFAVALAVKTFFVCLLVGGCSMILLAVVAFFSTF